MHLNNIVATREVERQSRLFSSVAAFDGDGHGWAIDRGEALRSVIVKLRRALHGGSMARIVKYIGAVVSIILSVMLFSPVARAVDVETLPAGVRLGQARFGVISGLNQIWQANSKLYDLGETRSVSFDAQTLARVNARARDLIRALDDFGSQGLGSKINLGTLNVTTRPEISYFAPVFAYGINNRWTVGVGLPVVHYRNQLSLSAGASNLDYYRSQFSGISAQLDAALNIDLVSEAQKVLAEKGYRTLSNRDEQFLGDVEIAFMHRLTNLCAWQWMHETILHLPTGPKDDPDDLMALNSFGRLAVENVLVADRAVLRSLHFLPYASLLSPLPDRVTKRVPLSEDDTLPDLDTKQDLIRTLGMALTTGVDLRWDFADRWGGKVGTESSWKAADRYDGSGRTDLLSTHSDSFVQRVKAGLSYSTVEAYRARVAKLPGRVLLEASDTVMGRNIERQLRTELSGMLFF